MSQTILFRPVGELVAEHPDWSRVFEELQIDYCCHGSNTLHEACQQQDLDPGEVLAKLSPKETAAPEGRDWRTAPLSELCDHIEQTHHAFLRSELPRLEKLVAKTNEVHGDRHPELNGVERSFQLLQAELMPHMQKEEQILFPAIRRMESTSQPLNLPFGSLQNPMRMMEHEHENVGNLFRHLRLLTNDYAAPASACNTYRAMLDGLRKLELDLHEHIHKENNILFPRAAELEASRG